MESIVATVHSESSIAGSQQPKDITVLEWVRIFTASTFVVFIAYNYIVRLVSDFLGGTSGTQDAIIIPITIVICLVVFCVTAWATLQLFKYKQVVDKEAQEKLESTKQVVSPEKEADLSFVKKCYWTNVLVALFLFLVITVYPSPNDEMVYYLYGLVYISTLVMIILLPVKSVRAGRGYYMLGHLLTFLVLPLFIGFGICSLAIVLASALQG